MMVVGPHLWPVRCTRYRGARQALVLTGQVFDEISSADQTGWPMADCGTRMAACAAAFWRHLTTVRRYNVAPQDDLAMYIRWLYSRSVANKDIPCDQSRKLNGYCTEGRWPQRAWQSCWSAARPAKMLFPTQRNWSSTDPAWPKPR